MSSTFKTPIHTQYTVYLFTSSKIERSHHLKELSRHFIRPRQQRSAVVFVYFISKVAFNFSNFPVGLFFSVFLQTVVKMQLQSWQMLAGSFMMYARVLAIASVLEIATGAAINPCNYQQFGDSGVCVCNTTYCDAFEIPTIDCGEFILLTSSKAGKRFDITARQQLNSSTTHGISSALPARWLKIDATQTFQTVIGFGGALTDATSSLIAAMPRSLRHCVYNSYMSPEFGAAYQMFRIPLGGSDFSDAPWTYQEQPVNDLQLKNITELHPCDRRRVEQLKEIAEVVPAIASTMKLMLCAWSPPLWMKRYPRWEGFNVMPSKYYDAWSLYHVKVLELWRNEGINFWSVSTGNAPITGMMVPIMQLCWPFDKQNQWLNKHLKPMLSRHGFDDIKILGFDEVRTNLLGFCLAFKRDDPFGGNQLEGIDMIGLHWYLDDLSNPNILDSISQKFKVPILYSESCLGGVGGTDEHRGPMLGSWPRASKYVERIIQSFSHSNTAFIDWNMILNQNGGPSYSNNFVDAPMIYDEHNGILYKQPIFYGIAHFSRFLHANCTRIQSNLSWLSGINVDAVAFACFNEPKLQQPHQIIIILHNRSSSPEQITIIMEQQRRQIHLVLDAFSVNSLVYRNC